MNKLAIRLWIDGVNQNVILMFLPIWFCHTTSIASTWQPVPEPINGVTGTWLSCFETCDWLRALVHLHCDVMITTSTTKTRWSCQSLGIDLPCTFTNIWIEMYSFVVYYPTSVCPAHIPDPDVVITRSTDIKIPNCVTPPESIMLTKTLRMFLKKFTKHLYDLLFTQWCFKISHYILPDCQPLFYIDFPSQ